MRRLLLGLLALSAASAAGPAITSLSPNPVDAGGSFYPLTVTGTGFQPGAILSWNARALSTTFVSPTQLQAQVTPTQRTLGGNYAILVTNPDGGVCNSLATVSPVLLTITPSVVLAGSPGLTVTAKGAGFAARMVLALNMGGQQLVLPTTLADSATLTATISASALGAAASATVQVLDQTYLLSSLPVTFEVTDPPTIKSATPNPFDAGGQDFFLSVNGAGFVAGSSLSWAGSPVGTTFVSPALLRAAITQQSRSLSGTFNLQVSNPAGPLSNQYPVTVSPVLFGIGPTAAAATGPAVTITATGTGFTRNTRLMLSQGARQTTMLETTYVNVTTLTAVIPTSALKLAGAATVQAVDAAGPGISLAQQFAITAAVPTLASIGPSSVTAGGGAFTLAVTGGSFAYGAVVQWNGLPLATGFVTATLLTATVPGSLIQAAGSATIAVSNPGGTVSGSLTFTVNPSAPVVTGLDPAGAAAGSAGLNVTVMGANFAAGSTVLWNAAPLATTYSNPAKLMAAVPANLLAETLSAAISVANPGGAVSNSVTFAINPAAPGISAFSPPSATAGGAGYILTVAGLNFAVNCVLRWNGTPLATTFVSATQVTGAVTADAIAVAGAAKVTLTNPSGLNSNVATIAVVAPVPAVSGLVPNSAQAGGPGFTLTVNGANFLVNSALLWNGSPLAATRVSATQLTAPVAAALLPADGGATVKVTTPGASDSNAVAFTIMPAALTTPPPAVTSAGIVNAASGLPAIAPGSLISIYGVNLAPGSDSAAGVPLPNLLSGTSVTINGAAAPLIFASPLQLNVQVPFETKVGTATLAVQSASLRSAPVHFEVVATAPGVLTMAHSAHAIAQNSPDQTLNSVDSPAAPGQYVTVYLTGQGAVDQPVATGAGSPAGPFALPLAAVEARVGGQPALVAFAGLAPGFVGLLQMNLVIPDLPPGEHVLDVTIGGTAANRTLLSVGAAPPQSAR